MEHRQGACSSCGAEYKIPASFTHERAKCKVCGGVVDIQRAAAPSPPAQPVPARKPSTLSPSSGPEEIPVEKKERGGPSMKERLLAERRANEAKAAARPQPPAAPAPSAAERRAPAASRAGKVGEQQEEQPAAKSGRSRPGREGARRGARGSSRSSARSGGRRRGSSRKGRGAEDEESEAEAGEDRRAASGRKPRKKNPLLMIFAAVLILGGGAGAWYYLQGESQAQAAESGEGTAAAESADPAGEARGIEAGAEGTELSDETSGSEDPASNAEGTEETASGEGSKEGTEASADEKPAKKPKRGDPASVDLSLIPDFGPLAAAGEAEFDELKQLMATSIDPSAGAAGNRARKGLLEAGRAAFPVILNSMKRLDFATDQGRQDGDFCQRLLMDICNGNNFGWKYTTDPGDIYFNKRVVEMWAKQWEKAADNDDYWNKLAKLDSKDGEKEEDASGVSNDDLDDLDDF